MTTPTTDSRPVSPSLARPRLIPGLSSSASTPQSSNTTKQRKRSSKHKSQPSSAQLTPGVTSGAEPISEEPLGGARGENKVDDDELLDEQKKTNAVEVVAKRLRAASKKIQRIETYEASTVPLNADQQRAIAGKPVLEAVIRELNEVREVLKAEEQEDEARLKRVALVHERKHNSAVEAAVKASKSDSNSSLLLLFQFLHLHSLFNPSDNFSQFAPPVLPPVIASATGQDVAAVRKLADTFTNGPLLGGAGDAVEELEKIAKKHQDEVLPGVSYARIFELIRGLTASPSDVDEPTHSEEPITDSQAPAEKADSVRALIDGDEGDAPSSGAALTSAPSHSHEHQQATPISQEPSPSSSSTLDKPVGLASGPNKAAQKAAAAGAVSFLQPSEVVAAPQSQPGQTQHLLDPASYKQQDNGLETAGAVPQSEQRGEFGNTQQHSQQQHSQQQQNETPSEEKVQHWVEGVATVQNPTAPSQPATPAADVDSGVLGAIGTPGNSTPTPAHVTAPPPPPPAQQQKIDWAADDGEDSSLPHLPELASQPQAQAPGVPAFLGAPVAATSGAPLAAAGANGGDGFQPARQPRQQGQGQGGGGGYRGNNPRGGRGGPRGGFQNGGGNGGSFRGPPRPQGDRPPRLQGQGERSPASEFREQGSGFAGRGGGRGGGGGGGRGGQGGRGGFRGPPRGGQQQQQQGQGAGQGQQGTVTAAPAAAPTA